MNSKYTWNVVWLDFTFFGEGIIVGSLIMEPDFFQVFSATLFPVFVYNFQLFVNINDMQLKPNRSTLSNSLNNIQSRNRSQLLRNFDNCE